jgi:putative methyltransferase (TIGR04325 family)
MDRPIWEGIFQNFHEVKATGKGFESDEWVNNSKAKVEKYFDSLNESNQIPPIPIRPTSLPLVASMNNKSSSSRGGKIIDFGGGVGFSFLNFIQSCTCAKEYEYHIIESINICKLGKEIFSDYQNLFFYTDVKDLPIGKADILYMNSVLQYIADWKLLLRSLLDLKPEYVLLDDVQGGNIPAFATAQNYYDSKIPSWFFNVSEILSFFESCNYTLMFKSKFFSTVLGQIQEIPMSNFPSQYRLDHPCTLLFHR